MVRILLANSVPKVKSLLLQLSWIEVDTAHKLSQVRIHVEHVIGVLRQKCTILESTLAVNMIMYDDKTQISMID